MIAFTPPCSHRSTGDHQSAPMPPNWTSRPPLLCTSAGRTSSLALQRPWVLHPVMCSSCDNHSTTCYIGHLVGHPPRQHTWVLGVPAFFPCYSCLICIIDVLFQALG